MSMFAESAGMRNRRTHKSAQRVWEELEGMPNHQVSRFQAMAPISPEKITSSVMNSLFTELAIVFPILNSPIRYFEIKKPQS